MLSSSPRRARLMLVVAFLALCGTTCCGQVADSTAALKQKRLLDCTLESVSTSDCDMIGYIIRVQKFAFPGFLIAIILIISCPTFCVSRYFCNCCGGKYMSPNMCCVNTVRGAKYSRSDIIRPRTVSVLCFLLAIGIGVGGYFIGTQDAVTGVKNFNKLADVSVENVKSIVMDINQKLWVARFDSTTGLSTNVDLFSQSIKDSAEAVSGHLEHQLRDRISDYVKRLESFELVLFALLGLPVLPLLIGVFAWLCSCRLYVPMCLAWTLFLSSVVLWTAQGLLATFSMMAGDAHVEMVAVAEEKRNVLAAVVDCDDTNSEFMDLYSDLTSLGDAEIAQTCTSALQLLCYDSTSTNNEAIGSVFDCAAQTFPSCPTFMPFTDLDTLIRSLTVVSTVSAAGATCSASSPCTVEQCASECTTSGSLSASGRRANQVWSNYLAAKAVFNCRDTSASALTRCDSIVRQMIAPLGKACGEIATGFRWLRGVLGLLGIASIGGIFAEVWGSKRNIPLSEADVEQPIEEAGKGQTTPHYESDVLDG